MVSFPPFLLCFPLFWVPAGDVSLEWGQCCSGTPSAPGSLKSIPIQINIFPHNYLIADPLASQCMEARRDGQVNQVAVRPASKPFQPAWTVPFWSGNAIKRLDKCPAA